MAGASSVHYDQTSEPKKLSLRSELRHPIRYPSTQLSFPFYQRNTIHTTITASQPTFSNSTPILTHSTKSAASLSQSTPKVTSLPPAPRNPRTHSFVANTVEKSVTDLQLEVQQLREKQPPWNWSNAPWLLQFTIWRKR